ncbi:MAG: methyl-accepting chemotaxis protein [Pseudomonadota bacterium]|jgi:methyl-accepting chemotaxis protein
MLARLSGSFLVKSVIVVMASCIVLMLALDSWRSLDRLTVTSRIAAAADASANAFKAMHNLRTDRASTTRTLNNDAPIDPNLATYLRKIRDAQMPALRAAVDLLGGLEFADKAALLPELTRLNQTLVGLQAESWDAMAKPKAARRSGLAKELYDNETSLLDILDKVSTRLAATIQHSDAKVDQYLAVKQMAWLLRNTAGEASLLVSNSLGAGKATPETRLTYTRHVGGIDAAWNALESSASGPLPSSLTSAMSAAKTAYFEPAYVATRDKLLNAMINGEKAEMTSAQWAPYTVERMGSAVAVAERALEAAKDHGVTLYQSAMRGLIIQLCLLVLAAGLAVGSMMIVTRRMTGPLHVIRDAMLKVAAGDTSVDVSYTDRKDEIGALANALGTFRQNAAEKAQIENEQRERHDRNAARQQAIENHISAFESQVRETLDTLASASDQMRQTSESMSVISEQTNSQVQMAAKASGEASANVQSVAAASEELSASIGDISRQVTHAASIASRAVDQARQTDNTVQGLSETASKIGDVVKLINDIAGQTNLLALNATIEAARAGEAGKGFAVVASEVKSLANQTAKATEEISQQIAAVQKVAQDAMDAIKGIGGTIGEVSEVATAIAAAVEEQGAATMEITRNTQQAAQGTKDVSDNITGVSAGADATGNSAQNVKSAAEALGEQAQHLRDQVNDFLGKIRAA